MTIIHSKSLVTLKDSHLLKSLGYIDGKWIDCDQKYLVSDPGSGTPIAQVVNMGQKHTNEAIKAAHKAGPFWSQMTARDRSTILLNWHNLVAEHQQDLARILSLESGKPLSEAIKEISYGNSFIKWFSEEACRIYGDVIPPSTKGRRLLVFKEPVGVVSIITPWNFPNAMITRKAGAALAAGCTIVIKPAPETPFSALALAHLAAVAGVPPGVLNVIPSSKDQSPAVGLEMTSNPMVKKLSFTGSTAVGKLLAQQCASTVKKVSLELGGNAPFIVFEDADLDLAVSGVMASKFRNAGQTCISANRIYVHNTIFDDFAARLSQKVKKLNVGHGLEKGVDVGPLISKAGLDKVHRHVTSTVAMGAKVLAGGKHHPKGGLFYEPTILSESHPNSITAEEETFGPLAALIRFDTEDQVMKWANDTPYGLAAYFYSSSTSRIFRIAEQLHVGMVGINEAAISTEVAPFGGVKESGLGREGSKYGIDEYLNVKYVCIGGIQESKL